MSKRVLLGSRYSVIEPLGILHLATIARQEGFETKITLIKDDDFDEFDKTVKEFSPDFIALTIYTGNHMQIFSYLEKLKSENPKVKIAVGGPHATYFPKESMQYADYVVLSEGFDSFRRILRGDAKPGIVHLNKREPFPIPEREMFYKAYPKHGSSPIKSVITQTGCPYSCTYCYNSSTLGNIAHLLTKRQIEKMKVCLGPTNRLFPKGFRLVDDIIEEIRIIKKISPLTKMIYFQDDVFGVNVDWIQEFAEKYPSLGLPFHAQLRFEYANPKHPKTQEKLELLKDAGCTGFTFAIESACPTIRREVLNRNMKTELMFDVMTNLHQMGFKVRTEQMLGLPCGATSEPTKINLEADLDTLRLNVLLKEKTGLPTMAWASIFAPYKGTAIGDYCAKHGFYNGSNNDVPATFFERSVLRFPKNWVGLNLSADDPDFWLAPKELEDYRNKLQMLRDLFNYFSLVPKGHRLAKRFLLEDDTGFKRLSTVTRHHLYDSVLYDVI